MAEEEKGKKDNGKKEKVKAWWHFNRIELGFLVIIIVIVFGITQPIIWCWRFGTYPPEGVIDIANLLLILITLLALGLTGFSVLIYEVLHKEVTARITPEIKKREDEAHEHIKTHVNEVAEILEVLSGKIEKEAKNRQNLFRAQMLRSESFTFWQLFVVWEDVKEEKSSPNIQAKKISGNLIRIAIEKAKSSLHYAKKLPEDEYKEDIYRCKNNWMYFLAEAARVEEFYKPTRRDKVLALECSNEILAEVSKQDYPEDYFEYQESCAWALQHLSEDEDKDSKKRAHDIIHKLITDRNIPPSWREEYRIKWKNSWAQQRQKFHEDFNKEIEGV